MLLSGLNNPAGTPTYHAAFITLAEAKRQCNITTTASDGILTTLIAAACKMAGEYCWRHFGNAAEFTIVYEGWPGAAGAIDPVTGTPYNGNGLFWLPINPVKSVDYIKYYDSSGTLVTLTADTDYIVELGQVPGCITMLNTPGLYSQRKFPVVVKYTAGYTSGTVIPTTVKQAVLMLISTMYEERTDDSVGTLVQSMSMTSSRLLTPHIVRLWPG